MICGKITLDMVCVCVCVCVWKIERQREESVYVCERLIKRARESFENNYVKLHLNE